MIVITGGAGMIGSIIAGHLNRQYQRDDLVIVDRLQHPDQWQNLCHLKLADYLDKDELLPWLERAATVKAGIDAIIHMGAISSTVERDFNRLAQDNFRYSQRLWQWCAGNGVPLLYASSAATYGDGSKGYDDDPARLNELRPLNAYGYSKHLFDQWALKQAADGIAPPQWCGFKFFNVYGPNEYHKERMASVAYHTFRQARATGAMRLFKSDVAECADGMQSRDFIYVKDAASVVTFFLEKHGKSGIFNVGTGLARSFSDLAASVMTGMGLAPNIEYIDMPADLLGKYQHFTQANVARLRSAGYHRPFTALEDGVRDYVQNHLLQDDRYC